ncbi:MAG: 3-hydroxyacyl-CoA dehydrogenase NAD-binding domain-containing protein, partial [Myxococcota bacterium]|nr:3-hydroxyacyl-CoA dehydrogenase NAD-binding domain-containing protein [Myxococcota bacterium]
MASEIRKVAVLGAGVMGQGIAAHLANSGIPSVLYDMVPKDAGEGEAARTRLAIEGLNKAKKARPALFFHKNLASMVTPANYEDHGALLGECDLIIEVVAEVLAIKNSVFDWVAKHRSEGTILASNTSGLSLADMCAPMSDEMKSHFLVMHFFNPVRYMRLLELVGSEHTNPEVMSRVATFGEEVLGKGIVYGKDTPNFIANRVGIFGIGSVLRHQARLGLGVEEVDLLFGQAMGRPHKGVFGLADLVGLDVLLHAQKTVYDGCPEDEERDAFNSPDWLAAMVQEEGLLGDKGGKGFYHRVRGEDGKRVTLVRDMATGEYAPKQKPRLDIVKAGKGHSQNPAKAVAAMLETEGPEAEMVWSCALDLVAYAGRRIPEIADDILNIDRAMRWGFNWDLGPFELWDAIGVARGVDEMKKREIAVPGWVTEMLAWGRESFYDRTDDGTITYWDAIEGGVKALPSSPRWLFIADRKASGGVVEKNSEAELVDLGDGALGLVFTTPQFMNALGTPKMELYDRALDLLDEGQWDALVVANQGRPNGQFRPSSGPNGQAFCAGANLMHIAMLAMQEKWGEIDEMVAGMQRVVTRAQRSASPVVTAPYALALGGGCEVAMQSSATQATGELYIGLVEVGMGLLPAGGGCKEMLRRYLGDIP